MAALSYQTAGESHGPGIFAVVNGMPAGVSVDQAFIDGELRRRQGGYGRGGRQRIETDSAEMLSGVRLGKTMGGPVLMAVKNKDSRLDDVERTPAVHLPRPGHADLAGSVKYLTVDCRETLERASARETAGRVAAGALARCFLREIGIEVFGFVRSVHQARWEGEVTEANWRGLVAKRDASATYCPDTEEDGDEGEATAAQCAVIREAKVEKDTVGGIVEAHVFGCPPGLGSAMDWRDKLDARIAGAVMGIQAFKGVEIGLGMACAERKGSEVHDPIAFDEREREQSTLGFVRSRNNAGGTEGGMTNGAPVVVRGAMKPIATLLQGMDSVDLRTKEQSRSAYERSDVSAISAASVVMENVVAFEIARVAREKFGGDSVREVRANNEAFMTLARSLPLAEDAPKV